MRQTKTVKMCSDCARAMEYVAENYEFTVDTHSDLGKDCPRPYME